jgi:hypothetical protein
LNEESKQKVINLSQIPSPDCLSGPFFGLKISLLMLKNRTTQFWSAWLGLAWNFIIRLGSAWDFFCLAQIGIEHFFAWLRLALEISTQVYH